MAASHVSVVVCIYGFHAVSRAPCPWCLTLVVTSQVASRTVCVRLHVSMSVRESRRLHTSTHRVACFVRSIERKLHVSLPTQTYLLRVRVRVGVCDSVVCTF